MRRILAAATMAALTWGAMIGAAEARDPTPLPAEYPTDGPTTTTTTIPVPTQYPSTPTTTTTVPAPVTTTTTTTTTTVPPAQAPTPTAPPTPEPVEESEPEEEPVEEDAPTDDLVTIYEVGEEHRASTIQLGRPDVGDYALISGPDGTQLGATGTLRYTPNEDDGGRTVVIQAMGDRDDGGSVRFTVRLLVAETNDAPVVTPPEVFRGFPGKTVEVSFTATDADVPGDELDWHIDGPAGMSIDGAGVVTWTVAEDAEPGMVDVTVTVTDDGEPEPEATSLALRVEIIDTSVAALTAVDTDGRPVNPLVIAASEEAEPLLVDLDDPGPLLNAVAARTPQAASRVVDADDASAARTRSPIAQAAVVASVQETFAVLLDLDVPTTAVAGGLAWQFMLLSVPGLFSRRRGLYDIVGIAPESEIGDETFRFRGNASGLAGGALRRRHGQWVRALDSPRGAVWVPTANLRASEAGR